MGNVFPSQDSSFSILEPLLCWLISSNIEIPCDFWYITEILSRVDGDIQEFLWGFPSLRGADERRRGGGLEFFYPSRYTFFDHETHSFEVIFHIKISYVYYLQPVTHEKCLSFAIIIFLPLMARSINLENQSEFSDEEINNIISYDYLSINVPSESFSILECLPKKYFRKNSLFSENLCSVYKFLIFWK